MKRLSTLDIRHKFLDFFKDRHQHVVVPTSSVIPATNQGTYFANSGMCQFVPIFLGERDPERLYGSRRLASCQRCIRVGGKHNDLDDVGKDDYHHTFFEMLGNWSFGSYSKADACRMAIDLLEKEFGIPRSRLFVTYFAGNDMVPADQETRQIWSELGFDKSRILPFERENFWSMDECGPCGPSTEIHFDKTSAGASDSAKLVNAGDENMVEIWNLVFMQYERVRTSLGYDLLPLKTMHVDTGLGLERLAAILQQQKSNYQTDAFAPIVEQLERHSGMRFAPFAQNASSEQQRVNEAMRIVADHSRMWTVALADGLRPGNANLEKKLRVVINRAFRTAADTLKVDGPALHAATDAAIDSLGAFYGDLVRSRSSILSALDDAYSRFKRHNGTARDAPQLVRTTSRVEKPAEASESGPVDVDTLRKVGTALRSGSYQRTDDSFKYKYGADLSVSPLQSNVLAIIELSSVVVHDLRNKSSCEVKPDAKYGLLLDQSPFYAHNEGGQRGDSGRILLQPSNVNFSVSHVARCTDDYVLHVGKFEGPAVVGSEASCLVDAKVRAACARAHSATHLLIAALQSTLNAQKGDVMRTVRQRGSRVDEDRLVLEFVVESPSASSGEETVSSAEIEQAEGLVMRWLSKPLALARSEHELDDAMTRFRNLRRIPEERYPQKVTVIQFADAESGAEPATAELCCGTHVHSTASIGSFAIVSARKLDSRAAKSVTALVGESARIALANSQSLADRMKIVRRNFTAFKAQVEAASLKNAVAARTGKSEVLVKELANLETELNEVIALLGAPKFVTRKTVRDAVRSEAIAVRSKLSKLKHRHGALINPLIAGAASGR